MPRKRKAINKGFPTGWSWRNGAIYYDVPQSVRHRWDNKHLFRLGSNPAEAYKEWAKRVDIISNSKTISQLLDRYIAEVSSVKSPRTRVGDEFNVIRLRAVFGETEINTITPRDVYKYVDTRTAKTSAKREVALLSHAYTKAVEWGMIDKHPFKGQIRLTGAKPRTRYVEDWEVDACLSLKPKRKNDSIVVIQAYINLKLVTGMRRGDLLSIRLTDISDEGLRYQANKTGKRTLLELSPALRAAIEAARAVRPVDISPFLFCTRKGTGYLDENNQVSGWDSIWQRFMDRVLDETEVTERFTEHDLRAKVASDAESLERAREILGHTDSKLTNKVYMRREKNIKPAK